MKPITGLILIIVNFIVALLMYKVLTFINIPVAFGHLYLALVLVDIAYEVLKYREDK